ncbi:MAG: SAM-dependent methyltransferase [Colwellia sp.]|nr:SAM-dependent methyltransferase [Colwellia sp.]MCW8864671.1 SAM-dependent methyltransferase [Colwellia sp.]MCW9082148.1 SAM-dependent methyltransferase [Colwellia sp.]
MSGSLVCVGTGMTLGAHITPIAKSHIEQADVVFSLMSTGITERWLEELHSDVRSLQYCYQEGKNRNITYNEMVEAILTEVRVGKKVVAAFYGHPGVFACVAHRAIKQAKLENMPAHMEAGISAEDCLYADLAIDPGKTGCMNLETSQFMFYQRNIDPAAHLVLWQVGLAGDKSLARFSTGKAYRQVLVDLLLATYPADHQVILYQAKVLPIDTMRAEYIKLVDLVNAELFMHTTLVIPPSEKMQPNQAVLDKLALIDKQELQSKHRPKLRLVL